PPGAIPRHICQDRCGNGDSLLHNRHTNQHARRDFPSHGRNRLPHGANSWKSDGGITMTTTLATGQKAQIKPARVPLSATSEKVIYGGGTVLGLLVVLEVLSRLGILPSASFPPASETLLRLFDLVFSASFWGAVGHTLQGTAIGLLIVCIVAVPLGLLIGRVHWIDRSTLLIIEFL